MHLPKEMQAITIEPNPCLLKTGRWHFFLFYLYALKLLNPVFFMPTCTVFVEPSIYEGGIQTLRELFYTCAGCL